MSLPELAPAPSLAAPGAPAPKIAIAGLYKTFTTRTGPFVALDDISLDIARGNFCTIVGPSGCGKTTLLRILAGLETPSAGRVAIAVDDPGKPLNAMVLRRFNLPVDDRMEQRRVRAAHARRPAGAYPRGGRPLS